MRIMKSRERLESVEGNPVFLFVHGIQGRPEPFEWLKGGLPEGTEWTSVLLPGHGEDVAAFRSSGMKAWQKCVDEGLTKLAHDGRTIVYVGHSMGCLLGLDAQIRGVAPIKSMMLLACPLWISPTLRYFRNNLRATLNRHQEDPLVRAAREANGVRADSPLEYLCCGRQYLELLLKMRAVRRQLSNIRLPLTAIHSEADEIVSKRSIEELEQYARCVVVPDSGHYFYSNEARKRIIEELCRVAGLCCEK